MTYIERLREALEELAQSKRSRLASVHWNVMPREQEQRRFPALIWSRQSGGVFSGLRHDVGRPVVRLALLLDHAGQGAFAEAEELRRQVNRKLRTGKAALDDLDPREKDTGKLLSDWPDEPVDSFDEKQDRPRVDWYINLRGE